MGKYRQNHKDIMHTRQSSRSNKDFFNDTAKFWEKLTRSSDFRSTGYNTCLNFIPTALTSLQIVSLIGSSSVFKSSAFPDPDPDPGPAETGPDPVNCPSKKTASSSVLPSDLNKSNDSVLPGGTVLLAPEAMVGSIFQCPENVLTTSGIDSKRIYY